MAELFTTTNAISLATLTLLEVVLGVDNVIFIAILTSQLPREQQAMARRLGIGLAVVARILLLMSISWVMTLESPLITGLPGAEHGLSGHDLILLGGGLFLIAKSTAEIHKKLEASDVHTVGRVSSLGGVIVQVLLIDVIFSLDSVITAVGMVDEIAVMVIAVVVAVGVMLLMAGRISAFVNKHPTVKMLALSFLLLIGFTLVLEGVHIEIPKGYIYFAMGFSVLVELLNLRASAKKHAAEPVHLHEPYVADDEAAAARQNL